ncbi:hypothetical protein [Flavobacterium sp.]|uniref:hypothetical protein n=1 Tax=Flavobacterium sp. TaxID=239 RepID=UPI003F698000
MKNRLKKIIVYISGIIICVSIFNYFDTNNKFQLEIEYLNKYNDKVRIYYTKVPGKEIDGSNYIDLYVYGKPNYQKLTINFPEFITPYNIRLDISENQKIEKLSIKNISLKYGNSLIDGDNGLYMNYWSLNESIIYNNENYYHDVIVSPVVGKKIPILISNIILNEKIKNIKPFLF